MCGLGFLSSPVHPHPQNLSMVPLLTIQDCKSVCVMLNVTRLFWGFFFPPVVRKKKTRIWTGNMNQHC